MPTVEMGEIEVDAVAYDQFRALAIGGAAFTLYAGTLPVGRFVVAGVRADISPPSSDDPFRVFVRLQATDQ